MRRTRSYAYDFNPPRELGKDDVTGELLVQRDDDRMEIVQARLQAYADQTRPLVDYYAAKGHLANFQGTESKVLYVAIRDYLDERLPASRIE